jgi:hypothetical protein
VPIEEPNNITTQQEQSVRNVNKKSKHIQKYSDGEGSPEKFKHGGLKWLL